MQLGMIGLGRMGANMVRRLARAGHSCVVYDTHADAVQGLERGYCQMIGGEDEIVKHLDSIFAALAPGLESAPRTPGREKLTGTAEQGYLHCGANRAGHFVKVIHNGIEYGIMAAYAEGLNILRNANVGKHQATIDAETTPRSTRLSPRPCSAPPSMHVLARAARILLPTN
jgi:6-phosphogluconate dehydrogenase (decarboxylating)